MAWEYPKHACGHDGERVQMYGPYKERAYKLARMEEQDCAQCRLAATKNEISDLPALQGTDKQIVWADNLRKQALAELDKIAETKVDMGGGNSEASEVVESIFCLILAKIKKQAQARFWIDYGVKAYYSGKSKSYIVNYFLQYNRNTLQAADAQNLSDCLRIIQADADKFDL
jgi:hypothetical protein